MIGFDPLLAAYLTFTFILAVTPGSTTAVVVRNTLDGGRGAGFAAAAGAALGNTLQATAAGLGLAVVFARWPGAIVGLRVAGALYLAWLGATSLWRGARHPERKWTALNGGNHDRAGQAADDDHASSSTLGTSVRQGLTVNLLNPAISTFYLVVVPSFVPPRAPWWYYALLASMHVTIAFLCHGFWSVAFDRLRHMFRKPNARRTLEAATGVALLALAVRVLLQA